MLNFQEEMRKEIRRSGVVKHDKGFRVLYPIKLNNVYRLSIQCSERHYCTPRKLFNIFSYETYEIYFLDNKGIVYTPNELKDFPRKEELNKYCKGDGIFGFVPKDLIEDIYNFFTQIRDENINAEWFECPHCNKYNLCEFVSVDNDISFQGGYITEEYKCAKCNKHFYVEKEVKITDIEIKKVK